jgi:sigma-B regulation protein RsbU (phosphoserine phosphatase)
MTMRILIAEDDVVSRRLLHKTLEKWGHEVLVAQDGRQAWEMLRENGAPLVIADWMMPEIDGVELCRKVRAAETPGYVYIILLTARGRKEDVVEGLEAGADDYVVKPFDREELRVRVRAGERIVRLEQTLMEQNEQLKTANGKMRADLAAAAEVQMGLLPAHFPDARGVEFAARFIPSAFVAGDIYDVFRLDEKTVGFYQADVSGHGVPAALLSVSISQRLSRELRQQCGLFHLPAGEPPYHCLNPPSEVIAQLDDFDMFGKSGRFFTMLYGFINLESGLISFCRAGHNPPLVVRADGGSEYLPDGGGGLLGLGLPHASTDGEEVQLAPGDRFIVFSDGVSEAFGPESGGCYGEERARDLLVAQRSAPLGAAFDALLADMRAFQGKDDFHDDVSILGFSWAGKNPQI